MDVRPGLLVDRTVETFCRPFSVPTIIFQTSTEVFSCAFSYPLLLYTGILHLKHTIQFTFLFCPIPVFQREEVKFPTLRTWYSTVNGELLCITKRQAPSKEVLLAHPRARQLKPTPVTANS